MSNIDVTLHGIVKLLNCLNVHKASGPDRISTHFLKETADVIAPLLQVTFKVSLNSGEVPSEWKIANITSILKKVIVACHRTTNLYHSLILLVKSWNKLAISSHIMKHLEQNHILYDLQYEFCCNRSCEL